MNAVSTYECDSRAVHLSGETDSTPYTIHGVALGADDVTTGASGLKKRWPADELRAAADTLRGTDLVEDHENSAKGVVGAVTKAGYKDGVGVIYEAELYDEKLADKISNGLLEVSIRGFHKDVDDLEREQDSGALVVEDIEFDNLSIVPTGASPSNTLKMGEHDELSAEELSAFTDSLAASVEAGDYVMWDDGHGIVFEVDDGDVTVEVMQEVDGMWRAVGEQQTLDEGDLEMWTVDEDDIGAPKSDEEMMDGGVRVPMPGAVQLLYPEQAMATDVAGMMGVSGSHEHELDGSTWYMPGETHDAFEDAMERNASDTTASTGYGDADDAGETDDESMEEAMESGSWVSFTNFDGEEMYGRIASVSNEEPPVATIQRYSEDGEEMDETVERPLQVLSVWDAPVEESVSAIEDGAVFASKLNDGRFVVEDVAADRVKISHGAANHDDGGWWERRVDIRRKLRDGVWMRVGDGDSGEQGHHEEEMSEHASYSQGDWVEWDTRNSTEKGTVVGSYQEGDDIPDIRGSRGLSPEGDEVLYTLRMYKQRDGTWHPIEGKPIGHYEDSVRSTDEPSDVSDSPVELGRSNVGSYDVDEHDWVQWYPSDTTEEHGFVVDVENKDDNDESVATIEVWTQNEDGEWETDGEEITKTVEEVEPWGNFPRGQEEFADAISGEDPRRAVKPSEENSTPSELISDQVENALKEKVEKHNEEYGDEDGKRVTYRMLKNVFNRGMGAYQDSHREGMTPQQWSYARVNAFLYLVRNGNPENDAYKQDNDLLPEDHPKYNADAPDDEEENSAYVAPSSLEASLMDSAPNWREGQMVSWQVNPDMFGEIVHVDEQKDIVMVEVHERGDDGPESTGFTVTAGYSDLRPMDGYDEMAEHDLDEVYSEWNDHVNMTADELRRWSKNPCSREASMEPVNVIKRNLRLLERDKDEWTDNDIEDAQRTISFISRMSDSENEPDEPMDGPHGCPSEWGISLLNWAHNPFDSMPEHPDNDDLDDVEEVELSAATLMDYSMHEVTYDGSHENEWDRPNLEDFAEEYDFEAGTDFEALDEETRDAVSQHFIISADGFPPEDYGDLKLPVVEPDGRLSMNALAAVKSGRGVSAVDGLTDEMEGEIVEYVNGLANDVFDAGWSGDEEEMMSVTVLTGDDLRDGGIGASKVGPIFTTNE